MNIADDAFQPQSLSTPSFPDIPVSVSDYWEAEGSEILDFRKIRIENAIRMNFSAGYKYLKDEMINNVKCAVIKCFYIVNENTSTPVTHFIRGRVAPQSQFNLSRIIGRYERIFYWDIKSSYWTKMEATITLIGIFNNGLVVEWKSEIKSTMNKLG